MISGPTPGDETARVHYQFDAWNRLVAVYADDSQNPGQPGDLVAQYEYDGTNRRVEKQVTQAGGGPRHVHYFYNHDWQLLEERFVDDQGQAVTINQYIWSQRYIDAPVVCLHDGNADGDLTDAEDSVHYYTGDANYNVTATIDAATGNVLERYVYTAYGTATAYDVDWTNPTAPTTSGALYCGYWLDSETGLYQVRNRYYDASLSVFISRDSTMDDVNAYRYARNSPSDSSDPSGLRVVKCTNRTGDVHYIQVPDTWYASDNPCPVLVGAGWRETNLDKFERLIITLCEGIPRRVRVDCEKYIVSILEGKKVADDAAIDSIQGWLEEHGIGRWGGRCHLWAGTFLENVDVPPRAIRACIRGPFSNIISLDPATGWETHHIVVFKNACTGKCVVLDDGFWGSCGCVYDPCKVDPPCLSEEGRLQWQRIRDMCNCK